MTRDLNLGDRNTNMVQDVLLVSDVPYHLKYLGCFIPTSLDLMFSRPTLTILRYSRS